jgi:hypothetical protein
LLKGNIHENDPIQVTMENDKLKFVQNAAAAGAEAVSS